MRRVPAHAGFFNVTLKVPGSPEWCRETQEAFGEWMTRLAQAEEAQGILIMPTVQIENEDEEQDYAELVLRWAHYPGDSAWATVEDLVENVADVAFPDLLRTAVALSVTVEAERIVGRDVELPR